MYDFHFDASQKNWVPWMQLVPEYIHNPEVKFLDILGEYKIKYSDDVLLIHNVPPLSAWHERSLFRTEGHLLRFSFL